jgi:hypothetical protein
MISGGSHTDFNDNFVGAGFGAGVTIGGALLAGVMNHRRACAEHARRQALAQRRRREAVNAAGVVFLELRVNALVDETRTQALVIEALRRENRRLRDRH